jgi:ferredoxin/flavodoxin---NADP+ reductase
VFEKTAENPNFSFLGNVTVGKDIKINEMRRFYDAIIFASGAETDRNLGINGEYLRSSHAATEFVGWYNGHPDFKNFNFDLSCETAVIVGQGNVAMDVARILCKTVDELKNTDIAKHALDVLATSKIKEVHMFGRRGPVQASFTAVEVREFAELHDCDPIVDPKELELNEASQTELADPANAPKKKNYEILQSFLPLANRGKNRKFYLHFYRSPLEILGQGKVEKAVFEKNELLGLPGHQKARGTGLREEINCGIFFRSVGYRGIPISGLPFHDRTGIIPNMEGRVMDSEQIFTGLYTSGWIKRGPTGIIGPNKPDSDETVKSLLIDLPHLIPAEIPSTQAIITLLHQKGVRVVSFQDWKKIDAAEIERGKAAGKPREKFTSVSEMMSVLS